ncbi:MAG TPA: hypothetical protein VGB73_07890 [Pyrinomonadaceae bacterium]|jgi:hypothetical protein
MKSKSIALGLALLFLFSAAVVRDVSAKSSPPSDVLNLRLDMSREEVHRRLEQLGARLEREERGRQEVWTLLREPRFRSVLVGYDPEYKVRYVTAIAREGGRRMRYSEVASLKSAYAQNTIASYNYTWEVKPSKKSEGYFVIVMGRDPQFLTSLSIKRRPTGEVD